MNQILIVEDDAALGRGLVLALSDGTRSCTLARSCAEARQALREHRFSLTLLDVNLPDGSGLTLLEEIRTADGPPVILLTAKNTEYDKVVGLDSGADDYVAKPFGMMELVARIRAVLRRTQGETQEQEESHLLVAGSICVDERAHSVYVGENEVQLTLKEYQLLCLLMKNRGAVLTRDVLLENIWGYGNESETRTVDVHIRTLRQKLGKGGSMIETVRGVGYRMGDHG